jgi:hypothetical protein
VKEKVKELVDGKMKLSQLTITKSLASEYSSKSPPAHKVLADRIAARDPGNAPSSGDRIGFVYVKPPPGQISSKLQGDRIETPTWIQEKKLIPDAEYYIEHQLKNPLAQLFGILVERMPGYVPPGVHESNLQKRIYQNESLASVILFDDALQAQRNFMHNFCKSGESKLGLGAVTTKTIIVKKLTRPMPAISEGIMAAAPKKQSLMDAFMKETSFIGDQNLARAIRLEQRKRRSANKEDAKSS